MRSTFAEAPRDELDEPVHRMKYTAYGKKQPLPPYRRFKGAHLQYNNPYQGGWRSAGFVNNREFPIFESVRDDFRVTIKVAEL